MERTLRFLSYNICHGSGMDHAIDLLRIAAVIAKVRPDCVALQEVDVHTRRCNGQNQLAELARLTGMTGFFGKSIDFQGGSYGNAILCSRPAKVILHHPLPGYEMRSILGVETATEDGVPYCFYCTHFPLERDLRILSSGLVCSDLAHSTLPGILLGDFNCDPDSYEWKLLAHHLTSCNGTRHLPTHPSNAPREAIDHGFFTRPDRWSSTIVSALDEPLASDHRPLLVDTMLD